MIKAAILGAGGIARKMAATITKMDTVEAYAIASREIEKAEAFQKEFQFQKAYGTYEEMLSDEEVELVYIATPHSLHYEHIKLCIAHGKHVLCEKAFTQTAEQAKEVIRLAKEKGVLLAEAMWTRYMPSRTMISDLIKRGDIGTVTSLTANLGYPIEEIPRLRDPELAGGALLDLGVYLLNFGTMVFGTDLKEIVSSAQMLETGVDASDSITMNFADGTSAVMHCSMRAALNRRGSIFGTKGYIEITNINNPEQMDVYDENYQLVETYLPPRQITGYEYEVEACVKAIEEQKTECEAMPHSETIRILELMDKMRADWGLVQ